MRNVIDIFPDELEEYRAKTREQKYLVIDVRQPWEYQTEHILIMMNLKQELFI